MTPDITNDALLFAIEADYVCGQYGPDCLGCPLEGDVCSMDMDGDVTWDAVGAELEARSIAAPRFFSKRIIALAAERGIDLSHLEVTHDAD
jgi:hypothetical protein